MKQTKFIVDNMLGKLAKWLRILGYDVMYYKGNNKEELIDIAFKEKRILLTRNKKLSKNYIVKTVFIESEHKQEQLKQVIKKFDLHIEEEKLCIRCPKCNTILDKIDKDKEENIIKTKVEDYIYEKYDEFWKCKRCDKYYWQGPHWINIRNTLNALLDF